MTGNPQNYPDAVVNDLKQVRQILLNTWRHGRRILVVLGAGASVSSGIPRMKDVFSILEKRILNIVGEWELKIKQDNSNQILKDELERLQELQKWLAVLAQEGAPRSISAMALGMLQRAHEYLAKGHLFERLHEEWIGFSKEFISDMTTSKEPSEFHRMIASWAVAGGADLISVNFDGLTRVAIQNVLDEKKSQNQTGGNAVVLSEPIEISKYFLGDLPLASSATTLVPVIKVWGDVFHAVCINKRCPKSGVRAPIFRIEKVDKAPNVSKENVCPDCKSERQLQIFFAGYEEKERATSEAMKELTKYLAPRVGCILTVGFSGLWDQTLVNFLANIGKDLQKEKAWRERLSAFNKEPLAKEFRFTPWINVDPNKHPPLLQELASFNITALNLPIEADAFARSSPQFEQLTVQNSEGFSGKGVLHEGKWEDLVKEEKPCPSAYGILLQEIDITRTGYLEDFGLLRQLGIKTRIILAATNPPEFVAKEEPKHNRQLHSFGAAHLAVLWFRRLTNHKNFIMPKGEKERLATVALFAAIHHDIGHLPFTHLAEEIFEELHWTLEDWSDAFHHDEPVLANCYEDFRKQVFDITSRVASQLGAQTGEFQTWVETAIQGRSGHHWLDAILNSPLDVDKLDYVFRDCDYLHQGIHVPLDNRHEWVKSLFGGTRVLPSGLVAFEGIAGEHARDFLEERRWLYKNQYHQTGFRALEKLAASVIMHWLLYNGSPELVKSQTYRDFTNDFNFQLGDTASVKGRIARTLLWRKLKGQPDSKKRGEPQLLLDITNELIEGNSSKNGLPPHPQLRDWARRCLRVFNSAFDEWHPQKEGAFSLMQHLQTTTCITCSESIYVAVMYLSRAREIIRQIETLHPFRALFDIAVMPLMLSYPSRRRLTHGGDPIRGECFVVAHRDPDRWGMLTNNWVPISESAFAERDKKRYAKIMVVSPASNDPDVAHAMDRFRNMCRENSIPWNEVDPDENFGYSMRS